MNLWLVLVGILGLLSNARGGFFDDMASNTAIEQTGYSDGVLTYLWFK
jgi:hypothetical protein